VSELNLDSINSLKSNKNENDNEKNSLKANKSPFKYKENTIILKTDRTESNLNSSKYLTSNNNKCKRKSENSVYLRKSQSVIFSKKEVKKDLAING